MKAIRSLLACIRKADETYNLFQKGDRIAVGISGGKDSIALLYCLILYQKFSKCDYEIIPINLDLGFPHYESKPLVDFIKNLGLDLIIKECHDVFKILSIQQEKQKLSHLPCSICSRMKKASINKMAKQLKCNKVAFAHHADDAIETLFMNMSFGGRVATFSPKMVLKRDDITFIRPFILAREKDITKLIKEESLDIFPSHCPADKLTSRENVKNLLSSINTSFPAAYENYLYMLSNYQKEGLWGQQIQMQVDNEGLFLSPVINKEQTKLMFMIRKKVFIDELKVSYEDEFLNDEEIFEEFLIYKNTSVIGTIRYKVENRVIKIGRFAILKEYRKQNYGTKVLTKLITRLTKIYTPATVHIHSMEYVVPFYKKLGFKIKGDVFFEANIPHYLLELKI